MLERARQTLGINDETAFDMHVACFNEEVREQLGLKVDDDDDDDDEDNDNEIDISKAKFKEDSKEKVMIVFFLRISYWFTEKIECVAHTCFCIVVLESLFFVA
jgi:hypothetical protein